MQPVLTLLFSPFHFVYTQTHARTDPQKTSLTVLQNALETALYKGKMKITDALEEDADPSLSGVPGEWLVGW